VSVSRWQAGWWKAGIDPLTWTAMQTCTHTQKPNTQPLAQGADVAQDRRPDKPRPPPARDPFGDNDAHPLKFEGGRLAGAAVGEGDDGECCGDAAGLLAAAGGDAAVGVPAAGGAPPGADAGRVSVIGSCFVCSCAARVVIGRIYLIPRRHSLPHTPSRLAASVGFRQEVAEIKSQLTTDWPAAVGLAPQQQVAMRQQVRGGWMRWRRCGQLWGATTGGAMQPRQTTHTDTPTHRHMPNATTQRTSPQLEEMAAQIGSEVTELTQTVHCHASPIAPFSDGGGGAAAEGDSDVGDVGSVRYCMGDVVSLVSRARFGAWRGVVAGEDLQAATLESSCAC
jgi:hypothetical protein